MKKALIVLILAASGLVNSVFGMDTEPAKVKKINLSRKAVINLVNEAKKEINFELKENGFISPSTERRAQIIIKLCNTSGRPTLGVELSKELQRAPKAAQGQSKRANTSHRKIDFDMLLNDDDSEYNQ